MKTMTEVQYRAFVKKSKAFKKKRRFATEEEKAFVKGILRKARRYVFQTGETDAIRSSEVPLSKVCEVLGSKFKIPYPEKSNHFRYWLVDSYLRNELIREELAQ